VSRRVEKMVDHIVEQDTSQLQVGDAVLVQDPRDNNQWTVGTVLSLKNLNNQLSIRTAKGPVSADPKAVRKNTLDGIKVGDTVKLIGFAGSGQVIDVSPQGVTVIDHSQRKLGPLKANNVMKMESWDSENLR